MTSNRISVIAAPIAILVLFGSALIGKDRLAFRDVGHFYTPLYDYVAHRTGEAWIPLWNPLDATGMPLLGETTTAVLYPPRYLIFSLPVSTDVAMTIYVVLHLILSSLFATLAARWAGASRTASRMAGVMYPLSGSVLFLYTNPPFLVGACWLPVVIASLTTTRTLSTLNRCLIAGPALAMMVTGGDPQTALHALLVITAFWIARRWRRTASHAPLSAIVVSGLIAGMLVAPQLAASIAWSSQSERVLTDHDGPWLDPPAAHSRRLESYQFSLPPWHTAEILTPSAFGALLPVNARVSSLIPGDGRMWTPTIYLGVLAAVMLMTRILSVGRHRFSGDAWMWLAIVSLLLSFGHFGIAWMLQQMPGVLPMTDSAAGGPYWFLYHLFPGYDAFRYPAKWLPVFSLASSIAVSIWIDHLKTPALSSMRHALATYFVLLVVATATLMIWRYGAKPGHEGVADDYWGPLHVSRATYQIAVSMGHSMLALTAISFALRMRLASATLIHVLLLIVAVDLSASAYLNISKIDRSQVRGLVEQADQTSRKDTHQRWMRTQSGGGWPRVWRQTNNAERLMEVSVSERIAWFGRWHLADRQAVFNNMVSIRSRAMADFWEASGRFVESMDADERERFWQNIRTWLRIDGVLHSSDRTDSHVIDGRAYGLVDVTRREDVRTESPFYFSSDWSLYDSNESLDDFLSDVHLYDGKPTDRIRSRRPLAINQADEIDSEAIIEMIRDTAEATTVRVRNRTEGVLVRSVFQDGSWQADIRQRGSKAWQSIEIYPVNFITQGIAVASGDWEIRFRYAPRWLPVTLAISAAGWLICAILLMRLSLRRFL